MKATLIIQLTKHCDLIGLLIVVRDVGRDLRESFALEIVSATLISDENPPSVRRDGERFGESDRLVMLYINNC